MYTISMKTVIRTWGNSLAIRIPKIFAIDMGIDSGKEVELLLDPKGMHIVCPAETLDSLLAKVTPDTLHGEFQTGSAIGKEVW